MSEILLVNPRRRKRRGKKSTSARRRRRAPTAHRVRRRRRANPRHAFRARRRRRSNPRLGGVSVKSIGSMLVPAAIGGAGAIALDVGLSYLPLPAVLQSGWGNTAAKVLGAIALGLIGGKVLGKEKGKLLAAGALTVVASQVLRGFAVQALGGTVKGLSGFRDYQDYNLSGYMNPAPVLGAYMDTPMLPGSSSAAANPALNGYMGAYMEDMGGM